MTDEAESVFHVDGEKHVTRLTGDRLPRVLLFLLRAECALNHIPASSYEVSTNVIAGDGGEDGRVRWTDGRSSTPFLPSRLVLFQCKATEIERADCRKEVLVKPGADILEVKPAIKEVIENGGTYILMTTQVCTRTMKNERIAGLRDGLRDGGMAEADTADIRVYDADKIAEWVRQYVGIAIQVLRWSGRERLPGAMTWAEWRQHARHQLDYVPAAADSRPADIRNFALQPRQSMRITGPSGIGKSRLVLESLAPLPPPSLEEPQAQVEAAHSGGASTEAVEAPNEQERAERAVLSARAVVVDVGGLGDVVRLPLVTAIQTWIREGLVAVLVVDNCPRDLHRRLHEEVKPLDSRVTLLSIDLDPRSVACDRPLEVGASSGEVIEGIVREGFPELPAQDVSRVREFASGFPQMAVLIANARVAGAGNLGELSDDDLVERLLNAGGDLAQTELRWLEACSLFEFVGVEEDVEGDATYVAERVGGGLARAEWYAATQALLRRRLLEKSGRHVTAVPIPLALTLAARFLHRSPPELIQELLVDDGMPAPLVDALCDRFRKLNHLEKAQEVVARLCGEDAPFGKSDVVMSARGARILAALAEVHPDAVMASLERSLAELTVEQLRLATAPRRDHVRALVRLAFRSDQFGDAARQLARLSLAENESWANNATGQFLGLFHLFLSGTEAEPGLRLSLLDELLESDDHASGILAIGAINAGLERHHFSRMGGAEKQGGGAPLVDWRPSTVDEANAYWSDLLLRLRTLAVSSSDLGGAARQVLAKRFRSLVAPTRLGGAILPSLALEAIEALRAALTTVGPPWPAALESVRSALRYEGSKISPEALEALQELESELQPTDLAGLLRLVIGESSHFDMDKQDDGTWRDRSRERAEQLAQELAEDIGQIDPHLPSLQQGEQRQGFVFGKELAAHAPDPGELAARVRAALGSVSPDERNLLFYGGVLATLNSRDPALVEAELDALEGDGLFLEVFEAARLAGLSEARLDRLARLAEAGSIPPLRFRLLSIGSVLSHLPGHVISGLAERLIALGDEGKVAALDIVFMYGWREPDKAAAVSAVARTLILDGALFTSAGVRNSSDVFHVKELIDGLLSRSPDEELVRTLARSVVDAVSDDYDFGRDSLFVPLLDRLLREHPEEAWPVVGAALSANEWPRTFHVRSLLRGGTLGSSGSRPINGLPPQVLCDWLTENPTAAPHVAGVVALETVDAGGEGGLSPAVTFLIDRFGTDPEVLSGIAANLGTRSWVGSAVPGLESEKEFYGRFRDHPNAEVRKWARVHLRAVDTQIKSATAFDEEFSKGLIRRSNREFDPE